MIFGTKNREMRGPPAVINLPVCYFSMYAGNKINTQYMTNSTLVPPVKIEYG